MTDVGFMRSLNAAQICEIQLKISVADPDPGWVKNQDPDPA
jgi:hypothetical protein